MSKKEIFVDIAISMTLGNKKSNSQLKQIRQHLSQGRSLQNLSIDQLTAPHTIKKRKQIMNVLVPKLE